MVLDDMGRRWCERKDRGRNPKVEFEQEQLRRIRERIRKMVGQESFSLRCLAIEPPSHLDDEPKIPHYNAELNNKCALVMDPSSSEQLEEPPAQQAWSSEHRFTADRPYCQDGQMIKCGYKNGH